MAEDQKYILALKRMKDNKEEILYLHCVERERNDPRFLICAYEDILKQHLHPKIFESQEKAEHFLDFYRNHRRGKIDIVYGSLLSENEMLEKLQPTTISVQLGL